MKEEKNNIDKKKKEKLTITEWVIAITLAYLVYIVISYSFMNISTLRQKSMLDTAKEGDKILISSYAFRSKIFEYGQIITINAPIEAEKNAVADEDGVVREANAIADYVPLNSLQYVIKNVFQIGKKTYIKRVIGLPGDHIIVYDDGSVTRNGELLEEEYLKDGYTSKLGQFLNVEVPEGTIFVMGDNRVQSMDSRYFGCIPISEVVGEVVCRLWPFNKAGAL